MILDLDGTPTNSSGGIADALNEALTARGIQAFPTRKIKPLIGRSLEEMIATLLPQIREEEVAGIAGTYRQRYLKICGVRSPLYPDVKSALDLLGGRTLVCASTKATALMREILRSQGIAGRFRLIQGSEGIPKKPAPDLILKSMELTDSIPEETLTVGDTALDVEAGLRAGTTPIGVLTGIGTRDQLREAGCQHIFPKLSTAARFIESLDATVRREEPTELR